MQVYLFTYDALIDNDGSLSREIKQFLEECYGKKNICPILKSVFLIACNKTHKEIHDNIKARFGESLSYIITGISKCYQDNKLKPNSIKWLKRFITIRCMEIANQ